MNWRKWLVRGLVFSVLGGGVLGFVLYYSWTNPATIRRQVLAKLMERFPGASVSLDSARLRLFGGIQVGEMRLSRRDDLDKAAFLYVPSAVIYHDKEQLLDGVLAILKLELHEPRLRVVRDHEGRINLVGVAAPPPLDLHEALPTIIIQHGTLDYEDQSTGCAGCVLQIKDVQLTVVNDPLPIVTIEGTGQTDALGPVHIHAQIHRDSGEGKLEVHLDAISIAAPLVERLAQLCPDAASQIGSLRAAAEFHAGMWWNPKANPALSYDATVKLHNGAMTHPRLPLPLDEIECAVRIASPTSISPSLALPELLHVSSAHVTARAGPSRLEASIQDLSIPAGSHVSTGDDLSLEQNAGEVHLTVEHLPVNETLFKSFPSLKDFQDDFSPTGPLTVSFRGQRDGKGGWEKSWNLYPEGMAAEYEGFRYPLEKVTGSLQYDFHSDKHEECTLDLVGSTAGKPVHIRGAVSIRGKAKPYVDLDIWGDHIPLDDKIGKALTGTGKTVYYQFHPKGSGDVRVKIHRDLGAQEFANRFLIAVRDSEFRYDMFPLKLEHVSGVLDLLPDGHWEARDFTGRHGTGEMRFSGRSFIASDFIPPPDGGQTGPIVKAAATAAPLPQMQVMIQGSAIPLDADFEKALAPPYLPDRKNLKNAWETMHVSGSMNFDAAVLDMDGKPQDLDVKLTAWGCNMQPTFFKYALTDVGGSVHYARDRVTVWDVRGRHGPSVFGLKSAWVFPLKNGGIQTHIGVWGQPGTGINVTGLLADAELLNALPPALKKGMDGLKLTGPVDVRAEMVLDLPETGPPNIRWDGCLALQNDSIDAGIELDGVKGQAACSGEYEEGKLKKAFGNIWFTDAALLGQPFHNLRTRFLRDDSTHDMLEFRDIGGQLFGGQLGGEGRIWDVNGVPHFEVNLVGLQVNLEQFGNYNNFGPGAEMQGAAGMSLFLKGNVSDASSLAGTGRIDVVNGKLYRLPPLLDLLKAADLRRPDRTAFEQAKLEFAVEGTHVHVTTLDLLGSAVSLRGQGTLNIDGSDLNLDFSADPGMVGTLLPQIVTDVQQAFSDQLLKIKVRGKLTEPRFEKELLPGIVEPARRLLGTSE